MIEFKNTDRGFGKGTWEDAYGTPCSIQDSSLASEEPHLWLGVHDAIPTILRHDARNLGMPNSEGTGWMDYPLPKEVHISSRMHLSRKQVKNLIKVLKKWVKEGYLPED